MKKTLALTLALVLALGLCAPALAAEPSTEEPWDDDYDYEYSYAEYEAAHPEEMAALDVNALLAGWGYKDMTAGELFLRNTWQDSSLDEAVRTTYIDNRMEVGYHQEEAADYKEQYPEAWAAFDAESYFNYQFAEGYDYAADEYLTLDKAGYMARKNILTEEEFVDCMFADCAGYLDWRDPNWWVEEESGEPSLKLMVNGVPSEIAIEAGAGTTYADAAALRTLLGDKAVAPDATGNIAIRPAAEAAGWDVQWYDSGWADEDREVQLWDKKSFETRLAEEFGPLNDFMAKVMDMSMEVLTTKEAISGKETVDITLTRFSTLDANKEYKLKLTVDYVVQNSVIDMTLTFDVSQLLDLVSPAGLARLGKDGAPSLETLTQLLKAGKMEFILDYDRGVIAYNVPLLALVDESQEGWQTQYLYGWQEMKDVWREMGGTSFTSTIYAQMTDRASWGGAEFALKDYQSSVAALSLFAGKDCFTTSGGEVTYALTTQRMNRALADMLELPESKTASFFKTCDLSYSLDSRGNVNMGLHIRPDMEGIGQAMAQEDSFGQATLIMGVLSALDMDMTASGTGDRSHSVSQLNVHWNNVGTLDMRCETTAAPTTRVPRKIEEVERGWVYAPNMQKGLDIVTTIW